MPRSVAVCALFVAAACSGGAEEEPAPIDPVVEGCMSIAEGTLIDAGPTPEEATELALGLDPYRLGLYPDQTSYIQVTTTGGPLILMSSADDVFASVETDGAPIDLPEAMVNPNCTEDILSVLELDVPAGTHLVGVGPHYQATVWLLVAER